MGKPVTESSRSSGRAGIPALWLGVWPSTGPGPLFGGAKTRPRPVHPVRGVSVLPGDRLRQIWEKLFVEGFSPGIMVTLLEFSSRQMCIYREKNDLFLTVISETNTTRWRSHALTSGFIEAQFSSEDRGQLSDSTRTIHTGKLCVGFL